MLGLGISREEAGIDTYVKGIVEKLVGHFNANDPQPAYQALKKMHVFVSFKLCMRGTGFPGVGIGEVHVPLSSFEYRLDKKFSL